MKTSDAGISFIKSFEKCRLMPYQDQGGKWTVGYGHLILPGQDYAEGLTADQADTLFLEDLLNKAEKPISETVSADLSQQQFDALASLCFNIGAGNFHSSTLVRLLNSGEDASGEFLRWGHVAGGVSAGLLARRQAEADIFINGNYVNHA